MPLGSLRSIVVLCVLAAALLTAGGMAFGSRARVQLTDAYADLGVADATIRGADRERVAVANAMVDGPPPTGFKPGPRIHPAGTLARLRYEAIDASGHLVDRWDVRALVPPLPAIEDNAGAETPLVTRDGCPQECKAELARGAALLERSGDPGMTYEWILRMPLHTMVYLESRPLITHDVRDPAPHRMPVRFERRDQRDVPSPASIRVTLVEACPGRVRVGRAMHLRIAENATLPIPIGFRTTRWVQIEGCGPIDPLPIDASPREREPEHPTPAPPPAPPPPAADTPPQIQAIVIRRKAETGFASLRVDEAWLSRHAKPIEFVLRGICRYDPKGEVWTRVPAAGVNGTVRILPSLSSERASDGRAAERTVVDVPPEIGLFWVDWIERAEHDLSACNQTFRDALATSGPVLCNDVDLGPAPAGRVAACVPFANRAEARFVPSPREACAP